MRISYWTAVVAVLVAAFTCLATASTATAADLQQPMSVQQAQFTESYPYFSPEEGGGKAADEEAASATACDIGCGACEPEATCGGGCGKASACGLGDFGCLKGSGIDVGGWVSAGLYTNTYGVNSGSGNGPLGFNNVSDGFTMNQLWIYAERSADTGGYGTDWGFRADYVFGVDGPDTQAFGDGGWDSGWNSSRDYGSAIPQLYVELAINELRIKMGHFYTNIGWEVVPAPDNFFYSHAYTMYYGEPFTHTGFLAEMPVCDGITGFAGWTMGWDSGFENNNDASTFLGGLTTELCDGVTAVWAVTAGDWGTPGGVDAGDIFMNSICLELALTDNLTYIFQHDLGVNSGLGAGNSEWYGINQYFLYKINECWGAGMRFEWFNDEDGARVVLPTGGAIGDGSYYNVTAGLNWSPCESVMIRPEIRYDSFDGTVTGTAPFNNGADINQFSGGFDVIYTF